MIEKLWVMWRDEQNARHKIGILSRAAEGFAFGYEPALPNGFQLLPEFPEHRTVDSPYQSAYLFPTFAERIPSPRRADYRDILAAWGVTDPDDLLQVLARSGGIQATDWVELSEWRSEDDDLRTPLPVRAAGTGFHSGAQQVAVGDPISLARERSNAHDPNATLLLLPNGDPIGYVPRPYTALIGRLLDAGVALRGVVERVLMTSAERPRPVVRIERALSER